MTQVQAVITTKWDKRGYVPMTTDQVESYSVDSAMDTDTDNWTIQIGDPGSEFTDVLRRDNEVRVNIFGINDGKVEAIHGGFADGISLSETGTMVISGRDISAVAVDSQHPPQIWRSIRPEVLVAKEARALKIGDKLKLTSIRGFKTFATDGSESYWQVWYRFYRKRRMWLWAEPDGGLNASDLNYNADPSYYFGASLGTRGSGNPSADQWIPVEALEWRADKKQRVGEVFYFGHRGDKGFVGRAIDPSTREWIKRPNLILTSSDVHNQAEATVEAWEEIFESKVGATEIKLTIADPGIIIRQNRMAMVNIPDVGLTGEFFVVGTNIVGSVQEGYFQQVRLRDKNYAISRRVPSSPELKGDTSTTTAGGVAANLSGNEQWKSYFVEAVEKFRGPWGFQLFLAVLLSICQQESGFTNVRNGGHIPYPGNFTPDRNNRLAGTAAEREFASTFANERRFGRINEDKAVGPMQLLTLGFKLYADSLGDNYGDELYGGRWVPHWNILAGAAALASKLGAGVSISSTGKLVNVPVTGLSLQPTEANMWAGVAAYGEGATYATKVKALYTSTYAPDVAAATVQSRRDAKNQSISTPGGSSAELRKRVVNHSNIKFSRSSQSSDILFGLVHDEVLIFMLAFANAGFPIVVTAMRSDHNKYTTEGNISAHGYGLAVDMGNYGLSNPMTRAAMMWIREYQKQLGFSQLIGPIDNLVIPPLFYDAATLAQHDNHIHVGWPLSLAK